MTRLPSSTRATWHASSTSTTDAGTNGLACDRTWWCDDLEVVQTWNASANEPMLRINRALGFRPVQTYQGWYHPFT